MKLVLVKLRETVYQILLTDYSAKRVNPSMSKCAASRPSVNLLLLIFFQSYSASGWEWRNDININSKFPAICEASSSSKSSKCLNNLCSSQATCAQKGSAYSCRCNDGYFGNGFQCSPTSCPAGTVRHGETCVIGKKNAP